MTALRDSLAAHGYAIVPSRELVEAWAYIAELVGVAPEMVECQPIRPFPGGRSFASTSGVTPFHTDSQDYLGVSPGLQVMVCRRAARSGGETRLVDGWALLDGIARTDPALHDALIGTPRHHRFYFGDVVAPSVSGRRGHVAWTHSPLHPIEFDPIGVALADVLDRAPVIELPIATGETLVVDNHRMLHGRAAFDDPGRDFMRLLAWFTEPLSPRLWAGSSAVRSVSRSGSATLTDRELESRRRSPTLTDRELDVVREMIAGVPPARLAAREGITEAQLYAWRSTAMSSGARVR